MGKALYFECGTGISGDMTAAALLDLGADREALERMLDSLPVKGFRTEISRVQRAGLDVCDFSVILDEDNHDHDMEYLYGHTHETDHVHSHDHDDDDHPHDDDDHHHHDHHHHDHGDDHHHDHGDDHHHHDDHQHHDHDDHGHHHSHVHRGLGEVLSILRGASMTPGALALAEKIFRILAAAEGKAHGLPEDQVHFHEVGAVDSVVDVASVAVCLDSLGIHECIIPFLCEGSGSVRCTHGILPVPVPAVLNIAAAHALPLRITSQQGELVTPTGAAIAAAVMTSDHLPDRFRVLKTGIGAGKRAYARPSLLRVMLIEPMETALNPDPCGECHGESVTNGNGDAHGESAMNRDGEAVETAERVVKLEANLDDCTGETLGYTMERLFQAGAKDVWFTPITMKKNRPGCLLSVLCGEDRREALEAVLFRETTTIGIRRQTMERTVLARETARVETTLGEVQVKRWQTPDGVPQFAPEYESAAAIARRTGMPFREVMEQIRRELVRASLRNG